VEILIKALLLGAVKRARSYARAGWNLTAIRVHKGADGLDLRQVEDIPVLRGSAAASCLAMSNLFWPPRTRDTRRYAA
jgi:hypothetical protein